MNGLYSVGEGEGISLLSDVLTTRWGRIVCSIDHVEALSMIPLDQWVSRIVFSRIVFPESEIRWGVLS